MYVPVPVDSNLKQVNQVLKKVNLVENLSPPDILTFSQHSKIQNNIEFQSNYTKHPLNKIFKKYRNLFVGSIWHRMGIYYERYKLYILNLHFVHTGRHWYNRLVRFRIDYLKYNNPRCNLHLRYKLDYLHVKNAIIINGKLIIIAFYSIIQGRDNA